MPTANDAVAVAFPLHQLQRRRDAVERMQQLLRRLRPVGGTGSA
jgi:hypothetical protein